MKYQQRQAVAVGLLATAALAYLAASGPADSRAGGAQLDPVPVVAQQNEMHRVVHQLQQRLHRVPEDTSSWARLGSSYVELARVTADPTYYAKAEGALRNAGDTGLAAIGMGTLANARHDFHAAREQALKAISALPSSAEAYGVLADALTQLGDDAGAQDAVQKMLDLKPNTASFARASFHFELHAGGDRVLPLPAGRTRVRPQQARRSRAALRARSGGERRRHDSHSGQGQGSGRTG